MDNERAVYGEPAYVRISLPQKTKKSAALPDYYARLVKRQPKALFVEEARQFWEDERR